MDATILLPFIERVTVPGGDGGGGTGNPADRMHREVWLIGQQAETWARGHELLVGDSESTPLGRARFERLAARLAPDAPEPKVTLFTKWLIWLFALDDMLDESPLGGSATAVHALYSDLLKAVRRGHARPDARPLEIALVDLWHDTCSAMNPVWRRNFVAALEEHRGGCAEEAVNRRIGQTPTLEGYPALRRRASAPFLLNLAEPVLDITLPQAVRATPQWQVLTQGIVDLLAWSNDVASYAKEARRGDVHNYLTVISTAFGLQPSRAVRWVNDEIALRAGQINSAARALPGEMERLGLDQAAIDDVLTFTRYLLAAPRAHLDWLLESGRYETEDESADGSTAAGTAGSAALPAGGGGGDRRALPAGTDPTGGTGRTTTAPGTAGTGHDGRPGLAPAPAPAPRVVEGSAPAALPARTDTNGVPYGSGLNGWQDDTSPSRG